MRTVNGALGDRAVGLAAEVAFFAILSLPPLLLTIVAALGFIPGDQSEAFLEGMVAASRRVFTSATVDSVVRPTLEAVVESQRTDILSIGFAVAVFSASRAVRVVLTAVSIAYDLEGDRPSWAQRLYGLLATLGLLCAVPILLPLLLAGPDFGVYLTEFDLVPTATARIWPLAYWLGVGVAAVVAVAGLYHLAAPWWTPFRRDLPGAALAVALWVVASSGLRTYTERAITGNELFQYLAGPLVLLVWLYLLAFAIILGAELNAELERMFPSPEQRQAPPGDRLRKRLLDTSAAARLEDRLPDLVDRIRSSGDASPDD